MYSYTSHKLHLPFYIAPGDYSTVIDLLTFTPTNTAAEIVVPITDDGIFEPSPEDFAALLALVTTDANVVVAPSLATIRITDDDCKHCYSHNNVSLT